MLGGGANLQDLWEDLNEAKALRKESASSFAHFLGTIVVAKNPKNPNIYDLIDGQQRATTVFMLRYALNARLEKPERNINYFLNDCDKPRIKVAEANIEFFDEILECLANRKKLEELSPKTEGQKRLEEVCRAIIDRTKELDSSAAKEYLDTLEAMIIMWLEESDSGRAIRMFQTVNDRGKPLEIFDKLKSLLILYSNKNCDGKLDDVINERFGGIFRAVMNIKNHKVASSLADRMFAENAESRLFNYHCWSWKSRLDKDEKAQKPLDDFSHYRTGADSHYEALKKTLANITKEKSKDCLKDWLDFYSNDLLAFCEAFLRVVEKTTTNTEAFKLFMVLRINPYFYAPLVRLEMNGILDDEILALFGMLEILFYGLEQTNDASAFKLKDAINSKENFLKQCKKSSNENIKRAGFDGICKLIDVIDKDNFKWKKYFHYLNLSYRAKDATIKEFWDLVKEKNFNCEIEHIISQNAINSDTPRKYGFDSEEDFKGLMNDFGNLLTLESSLNKKASDRSLVEKKSIYEESKLAYNRVFANSEDFLDFDKDRIMQENEKFREWAKGFFSILD